MARITRQVGRPSTVEAAIADWAQGVAEAMITEQQARDFVATGQSLDAYQVVVTKPDTVELLTADYLRFSVEGRPPGGFPPLAAIADWIQVKGIQAPGITLNSLAFLIARKIANEGNAVWRGDRQGIPMQEIIEESFYDTMPQAATRIAIEASNRMLASMYPNTQAL
jgi:hypothetical protein